MDLSKIISGLRAELQCMNNAIAAMEALEQAINRPDVEAAVPQVDGAAPAAVPVKRRRGRPRKYPLPVANPPVPEGDTGPEADSPVT